MQKKIRTLEKTKINGVYIFRPHTHEDARGMFVEAFTISVLEKTLKKEGYHALTATTGRRALALLKKEKVHLLLLDLKMPDMGGLDLLKKIRGKEAAPKGKKKKGVGLPR